MDPVSIAAGIIAIGGFTTASLKVILKVRGASDEVQALLNEISDLSAIVKDVEHTVLHNRKVSTKTPGFATLCGALVRANTTINHLHAFVNSVLIKEESMLKNERISRTAWMKQKPQVSKYQRELLAVRTELVHALGLANLETSMKIELSVTQIVALNDSSNSLLQTQVDHTTQLRDEVRELRQLAKAKSITKSPDEPLEAVLPLHAGHLQTDSDVLLHGRGGLEVLVAWRPHWACDNTCVCVCHDLVSGRSPRMLDRFLGSLFWGYSGLPIIRKPCNRIACRRKRGTRLTMSYYFPGWFVEKKIELTLCSMPLGTPQLSIKMATIVNNGAMIFMYVRNQNLAGLQSLFSQGLASPSDAGHLDGCTALHFAVQRGCIEIIDFLIKANADRSALNTHLQSPASDAWDAILSNSMPTKVTDYLRATFTDRDLLEERNFSPVHEIVLGLTGRRLSEALVEQPSLTDATDAQGNTPLIWAAVRGDTQSLTELLSHGADPSFRNDNGWNALYGAVRHSRMESTTLLLSRGHTGYKDGYSMTRYGMTTLHQACQQRDPTYVRLILATDPDVNQQDVFQRCPLALAAWRNNALGVKYLIEKGADKEIRDIFGATPFLRAVQYAAVDAAQVLLDSGCDVWALDHEAQNFLHRAALSRDMPMMDFIARNSDYLCRVDVNAKDNSGTTPMRRLNMLEPSAELLKAFTTTIVALENANQAAKAKQLTLLCSTTDHEDFMDAKEYPSDTSSMRSYSKTDSDDAAEQRQHKPSSGLFKLSKHRRRDWSAKYQRMFRSYAHQS